MYMVYWTVVDGDICTPHEQGYDTSDMLAAMQFIEQLRARQRAGEALRFITMAAEHPDSVGHPGVDVTGPGYDWKKRRH
jgi:hypothetical protein